MPEKQIVIIDGVRTPVGSFGGALKDVPAHELGGAAVREALTRAGVAGEDVREVVMGCIGQVGPDAYLARRVAVAAGLPVSTPAYTVNRLCGSGLQSIWSAAMEMRWNDLDVTVAGGAESMSRMPFYDFGGSNGYRLGDRALVDGTVMMLTDPFQGIHMGVTAENVATKYGVSRADQDEFAAESQRRAASPQARTASPRRSWPSRAEAGNRSPWPRMSTPNRGPPSRPWPRCARRSRQTAPSPRATPRESTTAARLWCWPLSRQPRSAACGPSSRSRQSPPPPWRPS